jgi:hypothetical protein
MIIRNQDAFHGVIPVFRPATCRAISARKNRVSILLIIQKVIPQNPQPPGEDVLNMRDPPPSIEHR